MNLIAKERAIERRQLGAAVLPGPSKAHILATLDCYEVLVIAQDCDPVA
jgi:hypothetical protein